ncbi:MAG TPA: hypothetical protein VFJ63_02510 [Candidatus Bathyarchaeia archaeon]|nr:hypothetical protein [Candidatus Bathyarchaeia archaeon]
MVKFIMSIGNEAFSVLANEAKHRDVTVQQLLRAVVVPDWIKENMAEIRSTGEPQLRPNGYRNGVERMPSMLVSPAAKLRQ